MRASNGSSLLALVARAAVIGLCTSAVLNLVVLFPPLPDAIVQAVVGLQAPGLVFEIWRATPYHMSAWRPFVINAALYAAIVLAVLVIRRRRRAETTIRAV